jgi:energy-coupling factor transporter ATP-binding protein EcfA2
MIWNPRGSIWHRWDPHIHAPGTLLSDQFNEDWEGYLSAIEKSDPVIRALGVTDYYCIQTYKEVRRRKKEDKRLENVFCIFPNVELRLDMKTAKLKPINIHLLFSPNDPDHEYDIDRILGKLKFTLDDRDYACSRSELIALGRACDPKQTDDDGAHRTGANQFKVSFSDLVTVFRSERKWLAKNCLVAVAGSSTDGTAGLQEDDSFTAFRRSVENFADIIFASTPKQRDFWLGKHPDFPAVKIEATYRSLKPCMHGCDAHRLEKVGRPDLDRFCWIKGDLSFDTLRQAVIEPGDRVWIDPAPPPGPSDSETLGGVKVNDAPWLAKPELKLNGGLITIIGARGSGKTALMEFLATGANAVSPTPSDSSFLYRARELLGNATVDLAWRDLRETHTPLGRPFDWFDYDPARAEVCYLSQQFVERLCSSAGLGTELKSEMERVVFESTPLGDRMQCESFDELANLSLIPSAQKREELQQSILNIGDLVLREETLREKIPSLSTSIEAQKKQIEAIQKELKELLPKDKEAHTAKLRELEDLCTRSESSIQALRLRRKYMLDLASDVKQTVESREPMRFQDLKRRYVGTHLSEDEWEAFRMIFEGDVSPILKNAVLKLDRSIKLAIEGDPETPLDSMKVSPALLPLNQLTALRDSVKKEVGIDAERQKKYEQLQRALSQAEVAFRRTEEEHALAKGTPERRANLLARRRNEYAEVFKTFVEEETTLDSLYGPLRDKLKESKGTLGKLAFTVERKVNLKEWVDKGEELLDLRQATAFRGHGALQALATQRLLTPWNTGGPEDVAEAMEKFRQEFHGELQKALREFTDAEQKRSRIQEVAAWLFDTNHIKVQYGITYEGTPIERLSPGTRGIVLLLMYLALDTQDRRPLFIDQPEENLDPHSVNSELVPHFRSAKQRRQVVMVTHNANLVVNTDADQVIIATSEPSGDGGLPTITYTSGGIENPKIRESICKLLEGGRRAFIERARRYRMYWGEIAGEEG